MWAVRISRGRAVATGAVLSPTLALTSGHLVRDASAVSVRVESGKPKRFRVTDLDVKLDVALVEAPKGVQFLSDSVLVPRRLWRGPAPASDRTYVELCTSEVDTPRSMAVRLEPAQVSATRVQFCVLGDREGVRRGYSGGPVVEHDPLLGEPRLVGVVRGRDLRSLDAFDNAGVGWMVPVDRIAERFPRVGELVETAFERDDAWATHWEPRSRGVATLSDGGCFFSGRNQAYASVSEHLATGCGLLVVTGERGRGKSALLSRVVTLSCGRYLTLAGKNREALLGEHTPLAASLDAAVLARGESADGVARQIGLQLGYGECDAKALLARCARDSRRPRLVIDAVDESQNPRELMQEVVLELAAGRAAVVVSALHSQIVHDITKSAVQIDLDGERFGDEAIPEYVTRRLTAGRYDSREARGVARAVARRVAGNFLVAELVARTLADRTPLHTQRPGWEKDLPADLTDAFGKYLARFGDQRQRVLALLHPLALARGDGLTIDPPLAWLATANALNPLTPVTVQDLWSAAENASDYLITGPQGGTRRLYHQGLADAVARESAMSHLVATHQDPTPDAIAREIKTASRSFLDALVGLLPENPEAPAADYARLDPYVLAHVATHLADHERAGELLERPGLLLTASQHSLRSALVRDALSVPSELAATRIAVVHALARPLPRQADRAAALCAALRQQGERAREGALRRAHESETLHHQARLPYELVVGPTIPPILSTFSTPHSRWVSALAAFQCEGEPLIVSGGFEGALRTWRIDGNAGPLARDDAHEETITAIDIGWHDGAPLIFSRSLDGTLHSWRVDGSRGSLDRRLARTLKSNLVCILQHNDEPLIISDDKNGSLRSWRVDGSRGPLVAAYPHDGALEPLAALSDGVGILVIGTGPDGALWSWFMDTGSVETAPHAVDAHITACALLKDEDQPLIIAGGMSGSLWSWHMDGTSGPLTTEVGLGMITELQIVQDHGKALVVTLCSENGNIDSSYIDGSQGPISRDYAHTGAITAVATLEHKDEPLIVTGGEDRKLNIWHVASDSGPSTRHGTSRQTVSAIAAVNYDGRPLIISASGREGSLYSWRMDGSPGPFTRDKAHDGFIEALTVLEHEGEPLVVSGGYDGALNSWRIDGSRGPLTRDHAHASALHALDVFKHQGEPLIVSGGRDGDYGQLKSWHLDGSPGPFVQRQAHRHAVHALAVLEHDGERFIISGGVDGMLNCWRTDGTSGPIARHHVHNRAVQALAVAQHEAEPLIISIGGDEDEEEIRDGELRSWHMDGSPGGLKQDHAHSGFIEAVNVIQHEDEPLVLTGGRDGVLRSWHIDGTPGALGERHIHDGPVAAIAVLEHEGERFVISGGPDGTIIAHGLCPDR